MSSAFSPHRLLPPPQMALKAPSSVRSYHEEIPHNRFFVSRGMSSLMENTNCHELRTPESFSPPVNGKLYSPCLTPIQPEQLSALCSVG